MAEKIHINKSESKQLVMLNPHNLDLELDLEADARLMLHVVCLDGADSDNRITVRFLGEGAEADIYGLALTCGLEKLAIDTLVLHEVGGCKSRQTFKYLLRDNSSASFHGLLRVAPNAQHTDASQTDRNILLSPTARMHSEPQLEIYADDVKCSHGATTGQLDESALFYMQQRGLSPQTARALLLQAFCSDVIEQISDDRLRLQISEQIEQLVK